MVPASAKIACCAELEQRRRRLRGDAAARRVRRRCKAGAAGDVTVLKGDAAERAKRWSGEVEALTPEVLDGAALVIDAVFGAGLSRPLEGAAARNTVVQVNNADLPVISVDVPSGIDGTTGAPVGALVIEADRTVTFFRRKPWDICCCRGVGLRPRRTRRYRYPMQSPR